MQARRFVSILTFLVSLNICAQVLPSRQNTDPFLKRMTKADRPKPNTSARQSSFSAEISVPLEKVKPGTEIKLTITLRNTSGHQLALGREQGEFGEYRYAVKVTDRRGNAPSLTKYHRGLRERDFAFEGGGAMVYELSPGQQMNDAIVLTNLFDLSSPGRYCVHVEIIDPFTEATVVSNTLTITVTR